jgi:hypothetical protein
MCSETDDFWNKINPIKIKQDQLEKLKISLHQDPQDSLRVNLWSWILTNSSISNNRWEPLKIKIINEEGYLFKESWEAKISSRALISIWILWILYGNNITISSFFWTKINDSYEMIPWIIFWFIFIELLIFLSFFYRDIKKFQIKKTSEKIWIKNDISKFKKKLKENTDPQKMNEIQQSINRLEFINSEISIQVFNKNIIYLWFKTIYPLFIWILWLKYLWYSSFIKFTDLFWIIDVLIFLIISISLMLITKFILKNK